MLGSDQDSKRSLLYSRQMVSSEGPIRSVELVQFAILIEPLSRRRNREKDHLRCTFFDFLVCLPVRNNFSNGSICISETSLIVYLPL